MVFLSYAVFLILLFAVQTTVLGLFSFAGVTPDLALIFALYCGIYFQGNTGAVMGGLTGLIQDCLSGRLLGLNTLSKSLISFSISTIKDKIQVENTLPVCLFLVVASVFDGLIFYLLSFTLLKGGETQEFLFPSLLIYAAYNALVGPFLFFILKENRKWLLQKTSNGFSRQL